MGLKNILVHLDGSPRTPERLQLALALARRDNARLVGVFAQMTALQTVGVNVVRHVEGRAEAAEASKAAFAQIAQGYAGAVWQDIGPLGEMDILGQFTALARVFDLVVLGQLEEGVRSLVPVDLAEQVITESGRPVLVVPYIGSYADVGHRPLIAWAGMRAAARALNDGICLMPEGAQAVVVSVDQPRAQHGDVEALLSHLAAHGVHGVFELLAAEGIGLMDTLLNRAVDHGADMLVLGAFGGHGFAFISRGSGTRYMLRHMTVPVLFSH